jgi:hypothetical protein
VRASLPGLCRLARWSPSLAWPLAGRRACCTHGHPPDLFVLPSFFFGPVDQEKVISVGAPVVRGVWYENWHGRYMTKWVSEHRRP